MDMTQNTVSDPFTGSAVQCSVEEALPKKVWVKRRRSMGRWSVSENGDVSRRGGL